MEKLEYSPSRTRLIIGAVCAVAVILFFTGICALLMLPSHSSPATPQQSHLGLYAFCGAIDLFMGYSFWVTIRKLRAPKVQLLLDDEGVLDATLPYGKIPWHTILSIRAVKLRKSGVVYATMMVLDVVDEQERLARLTSMQRKLVVANQALGYGAINLNLTTLPITPDEFVAQMNARRHALGLPALTLS